MDDDSKIFTWRVVALTISIHLKLVCLCLRLGTTYIYIYTTCSKIFHQSSPPLEYLWPRVSTPGIFDETKFLLGSGGRFLITVKQDLRDVCKESGSVSWFMEIHESNIGTIQMLNVTMPKSKQIYIYMYIQYISIYVYIIYIQTLCFQTKNICIYIKSYYALLSTLCCIHIKYTTQTYTQHILQCCTLYVMSI